MRASAAVLRDAKGAYAIEEIMLDELGPGDVAVKVAGVGFCHTDVLPRVAPIRLPIVCGHGVRASSRRSGPT